MRHTGADRQRAATARCSAAQPRPACSISTVQAMAPPAAVSLGATGFLRLQVRDNSRASSSRGTTADSLTAAGLDEVNSPMQNPSRISKLISARTRNEMIGHEC